MCCSKCRADTMNFYMKSRFHIMRDYLGDLVIYIVPYRRFYGSRILCAREVIIVCALLCWYCIGLYRDVWIAAIASSRKSLATQTAAICVHFQGRRVRHEYVTMHITFLTRKSALIYRRGLRQRVASLTLDCNGVFAIRAYAAYLPCF